MAEDRDTEARWYVVHTYSGYENKVAQNLETIVENRRLQELIHEVKVPVELVPDIKDGKEMIEPLTERLDAAHMDYRLLLLSDHKTLTATRGHDGDPVPYLLYDSRIDSGRGGVYTEKAGENGPFVAHGCELLHLLFER